jgi:hypothetical protein
VLAGLPGARELAEDLNDDTGIYRRFPQPELESGVGIQPILV